jgi:hypothetical protein
LKKDGSKVTKERQYTDREPGLWIRIGSGFSGFLNPVARNKEFINFFKKLDPD